MNLRLANSRNATLDSVVAHHAHAVARNRLARCAIANLAGSVA